MNKIYKVVFNKSLSTYVAVSEHAKGHSKSSKTKTSALVAAGLISIAGVASASYLAPKKPLEYLSLENTTYHPETIPNKVTNDLMAKEDDSDDDDFRGLFDLSLLAERDTESSVIRGFSTGVEKIFDNQKNSRIFKGIEQKGNSTVIKVTQRKPIKPMPFYWSSKIKVISKSDKYSLIDADTLYKDIPHREFFVFGRAIQNSSKANIFNNNDANSEVVLKVLGAKSLLLGNVHINGKTSKISILDGGIIKGNVVLDAKSNYLKLIADSNFRGNLTLKNSNIVELLGNSSFKGDIVGSDDASIDYISKGSYHQGIIKFNGNSDRVVSNTLEFHYGSRQIGDITLSSVLDDGPEHTDKIILDTNSVIKGNINLGNGNNLLITKIPHEFGTGIVNSAIIGNITGGSNSKVPELFDQDKIQLSNTDIVGNIDLKDSGNFLSLSSFSSLQGNYTGGVNNDELEFSSWTYINKDNPNQTFNLGDGTNTLKINKYSKVFGDYVGGANIDRLILDSFSEYSGNVNLGNAESQNQSNNENVLNSIFVENLSLLKGNVTAGKDRDLIYLSSSALIGNVDLGSGDNSVILEGSQTKKPEVSIDLPLGINKDKYLKPFGFINIDGTDYSVLLRGNLVTGIGDDKLIVSEGELQGDVLLGAGNNKIILKGGNASLYDIFSENVLNKLVTSKISGSINTLDGNDSLHIQDAEINGDINLGDGNNVINLLNGSVTKGSIITGLGNDIIVIENNSQNKSVSTGAGDDEITIKSAPEKIKDSVIYKIDGGDDQDTLSIIEGSQITLKDEGTIANVEQINIKDNSVLELKNLANIVAVPGSEGVSDTNVYIEEGSSLFVNKNKANSDYILNYNLLGEGLLKLDLNNNQLLIKEGQQEDFAGTVELLNGEINLNSNNRKILAKSSLILKDGGVIKVIQANNNIDKTVSTGDDLSINILTLDGGALHLAKHTPVGQIPSASLKVKDLKVVAQDGGQFGKGFIVVESFNKYDNTVASGNNKAQSAQGLLSQDDGEFVANLVEASGTVTGGNLKLEIRKDLNSSSEAVHTTDILQGNEVVARANFGYKARVDAAENQGAPKGINAVYGLKEIELLEGKQLDLVVDGAESKSDLSAKLTGAGGIDINKDAPDTTVLSLSNPANDYKGATRVLKGTLLAKSSNVLGSEESHTKTLKLADNTKLKLADAVKVYVGNVDQAASSKLDLGNGTLNIVHDGETKESTIKANSLIASAEGGVVLHNGATTFEGPQETYKGTTTIRNKAHASIANVKALGTGAVDIQDKGTLNLNLAEAAELTNQIKGNGTVIKYGKGALTLNPSEHTSAFEGTINLSEGSLIAGTAASALTLNAKEINVLQGNTLQAVGALKGSLNNAGIVQVGSGNVPGDTYTVGNYDGAEGSELQLSAEWKKSGEFKSDKLVVLGIATGKTKVKAGPENLIKGDIMQGDTDKFSTDVIEVAKAHEGDVFFGQAETDGAFKADLVKVGNNYRWKIGAKLNPATPTFIAGKLASIINVYDSVGTLSERVAAQRHAMNAGGNVYGRISHGNAKFGSLRGQEYAFKNSQIQFGVGMLTSHGKDHSKTEVGLLASYGKNDVTVYDGETGSSSLFNFKGIGKNIAKTFSKKKAKAKGNEVAAADTKPKAKKVGSIDSNVISLGLYTTGYLASGVYYDVVAQVSGIKNKYTTEDKKTSSQNGLATQLSVEVGHALPLGDSGWSATPQVQVVGQYLKLGGYKHAVRKIDLSNDFSVRGRVGLSIAHEDDFYVSANVLGELTKPLSLKVGKDTVKESFNKYWGEVGVGGQVNLSKSSAFYADAKFIKNFTGEKRTGYKGNVGFKYSW